MNSIVKNFLLLLSIVLFVSCKMFRQQEQERHYAEYKPVFNQTQRAYVETPSVKDARLDTVVQVLSNLRDEVYNFKDTIAFTDELDFFSGELIIDIDLINEKPPIFDTFMVVKGFKMERELVNSLFPVIPDSFKTELLMLSDSAGKSNDSIAVIDSIIYQPVIQDSSLLDQSLQPDDSLDFQLDLHRKRYYTREDILSDTTRDLLDADTIIAGIFASSGWKIGDSIPYYSGFFSEYLQDSTLLLITEMVFVEIHDPAREVKQYSRDKLTKEIVEKKMVSERFIHTNKVVFRRFYKDEEDVFMDMVRVRGGSFKIGSSEFDEDERPEYGLKVSDFLIGKYEVTNDVFCSLINMLKCDSLGKINRLKVIDWKSRYSKIYWDYSIGRFKVYKGFEKFPVVNVSWAGANLVCKQMGGRLPSEAEWEYAAKGGVYAIRYYTNSDKTDYAYEHRFAGSNVMGEVGFFVDNSDGYCQMVGGFLPNRLGIFDMCGNVWEWCYDNYDKDFYKRNGDSTDPQCINSNGIRVNRGGSWSSDAMYCRITNRNFLGEFEYNPYLGFRLMLGWVK